METSPATRRGPDHPTHQKGRQPGQALVKQAHLLNLLLLPLALSAAKLRGGNCLLRPPTAAGQRLKAGLARCTSQRALEDTPGLAALQLALSLVEPCDHEVRCEVPQHASSLTRQALPRTQRHQATLPAERKDCHIKLSHGNGVLMAEFQCSLRGRISMLQVDRA